MVCNAGVMKGFERDDNSSAVVVLVCCHPSSDSEFASTSCCSLLYLFNSVLFLLCSLSIIILVSSFHINVVNHLEMSRPVSRVSGMSMHFLTSCVRAALYMSLLS